GNNNLCIFASTTGNIIKDSGRPLADLVTIDGGSILFGILSSSMNIWARGQPCVLSKLTHHTSVTVTNTTTATAVFTAGGSVGGTIYTNNSTQVGTVIKVRAWFQINNWAGGGTLSIRLDVNSVAYGTLTIPSPPTGNYFKVEFDLTVRPSNLCRINGVALLSGGNNVFVDSGNTWNVASSYGLNVTVKWSVASGSNTVSGLTGSIETHYQQ
ncbi:MAG TPA: hypothetical protein PLS50_03480, partial [Candidatus Dojkabacteria bacterium]|nr:hypothetical protein [Candidatus Dojkabacteria bacterium]